MTIRRIKSGDLMKASKMDVLMVTAETNYFISHRTQDVLCVVYVCPASYLHYSSGVEIRP
ncbi:MAG: hypothetical protein GX969_06115 [Firmicutes bacterium]|nr:hypothetical protein [Bacillota bacterium]